MSLDEPGHPTSTVTTTGLEDTGLVCVPHDALIDCYASDGSLDHTADVEWLATPSDGAVLVDGGEHGWWELDGSLLQPLDVVAEQVDGGNAVTVTSAQQWDVGTPGLPPILGAGPGAALGILGLVAVGVIFAAIRKARQDDED